MSNKAKNTSKTVSPKTNVSNVPAKDAILTETNLSKVFSDVLAKIPEGSVNTRSTYLYKYADHGIIGKMINDSEGKNFRTKRRNAIENFCKRMRNAVSANNMEDVKKIIADFKDVYTTFYTVNDFSLGSVTQSNKADERASIDAFLSIVRELNK